MLKFLIPALASEDVKQQFKVGTRSHNQPAMRHLQSASAKFWTCDVNPETARHGTPDRHVTCDVRHVGREGSPIESDKVLMKGIFRRGVNTLEDCARAIEAAHRLLTRDGLILLGWSTDRCSDTGAIAEDCRLALARLGKLDHCISFKGSSHVYGFLRTV